MVKKLFKLKHHQASSFKANSNGQGFVHYFAGVLAEARIGEAGVAEAVSKLVQILVGVELEFLEGQMVVGHQAVARLGIGERQSAVGIVITEQNVGYGFAACQVIARKTI